MEQKAEEKGTRWKRYVEMSKKKRKTRKKNELKRMRSEQKRKRKRCLKDRGLY